MVYGVHVYVSIVYAMTAVEALSLPHIIRAWAGYEAILVLCIHVLINAA